MTSAAQATDSALTKLDDLTVVRITGPDTNAYLQGQLTADLDQLTASRSRLACLNSPKGRVQAVVWLVRIDEGVLLVCPREIESWVTERLRRYVLRAKVAIEPAGPEWRCYASTRTAIEGDRSASAVTPVERGITTRIGAFLAVTVSPQEDRCLVLGPADTRPTDGSAAWRLAEIRAGHPQIYEATWESFVAQMLNLDLLEAISFSKGCYTGQEIIARAHYRGAVKRRMVRLRAPGSPPQPGTRVLADDEAAGEVVVAAADADACELLAVVSLGRLDADLRLESGVALERLALPYDIAATT
jgi:hypothetical protein